jgi:hypothetical protein
MRRAVIGLASTVGALIGCDAGSGTSLLCDTQVAVTVANGPVPQFSWTAPCFVQRVHVYLASAPSVGGPQPIWGIERAAGMAPPVTYGQTPAGAQVLIPAELLESGAHYLVEVAMTEFVGNSMIVGEHGFVR